MNALAKKILIKPGKSWLFYNTPEDYLTLLQPLPDGVNTHFEAEGNFDGIQFFVRDSGELNESLTVVGRLVKPETTAWYAILNKAQV